MKKLFLGLCACCFLALFSGCDNTLPAFSEDSHPQSALQDTMTSDSEADTDFAVELIPLSENETHYTDFALNIDRATSIRFSGNMLKAAKPEILEEDVTGDGVKEYVIILIKENEGDRHKEEIHVFDGISHAEYPVDTDALSSLLADTVSSEYYSEYNQEKKRDDSYYKLHIGETVSLIAYDDLESEHLFFPEHCVKSCSEHYRYGLEDGKIKITFSCFSGWNEVCGYVETFLSFIDSSFQPQQLTFRRNDSLLEQIAERKEQAYIVDGDFTYARYKNGLKVVAYTGTDSEVTIPESYNGIPIVCVGEKCFWGNDIVSDVTMNGIYEIGNSAFGICSNLKRVVAPKAVTVGVSAFDSSLESAVIDSAVYIGSWAFEVCNLTEISLPNAEFIGHEAFYGTKLKEVSLPKTKFIGHQAFGSCGSLTRAYLPNVETIDKDAFFYCEKVTLCSRSDNTAVKEYYDYNAWRGNLLYEIVDD